MSAPHAVPIPLPRSRLGGLQRLMGAAPVARVSVGPHGAVGTTIERSPICVPKGLTSEQAGRCP